MTWVITEQFQLGSDVKITTHNSLQESSVLPILVFQMSSVW